MEIKDIWNTISKNLPFHKAEKKDDLTSVFSSPSGKIHPGVIEYIPDSEYNLPDDAYKPLMKTSPEHLKPGSRVLKNGWEMMVSNEKPSPDDPRWKEVKMPSQWAVEDPKLFSNTNNVWYMKKFMVKPGEAGIDKHTQLEFKGVDYKAQVYVNDEKLGEHEGYFSPFSVNLDDKVEPGKVNNLMVEVSAPLDFGLGFLKNQLKGVLEHHDCRPGGVRQFGIPEPVGSTGGIWNDVILESSGRETIENQYVNSTLSPDHKKADLSFNYLLMNHGDSAKQITVETRYAPMGEKDPAKFKVVKNTVDLKPGFNQVALETAEENPKLWWTYDKGDPNLYQMETRLYEGEKISDSAKGHFGIRKIDYDPKTRLLKLNDTPIYQKGSNYIATEWLSTYNEGKFDKDLRLMKEAHLNAVRAHGHVLPQEFYDAADKEGMLVWADFPLHWGTSTTPLFIAKASRQYQEFIEDYRNHPSIWLWNAHNEPLPYDFVLDRILDSKAAALDPTRAHKPASGMTEHFYPGWYPFPYGDKFTGINLFKPALPSEFGAQGIPESMKKIIPKDQQWPINENQEKWKFHDFQTFNNYKYVGEPKAFKNLDDYIETSQKYQYDYNKYVTEYFRRLKYKPTTGMYQFMFKEAWPAVGWGVMDDRDKPKMAFEAMKDAMNPTLASIEWKKNNFKPGDTVEAPIWLVNDKGELKNTDLKWKIYDASDKEKRALSGGAMKVLAPADSSNEVYNVKFQIPQNAKAGQKWVLEANWNDASGKKLSHNAYMFEVPKPVSGPYRYEPVNPEYPSMG